jgi:hypothetical protein
MKHLMLIVCWCISLHGMTQFSIAFNVRNLYAKEYDQIIRTYNAMRPWQTEKQPFLTLGWVGAMGWQSPKPVFKGIYLQGQCMFGQFRSSAENNGETKQILLRQWSIHLGLQFHPKALFRAVSAGPLGTRWFLQWQIGTGYWQAFSKRNGESFEDANGLYAAQSYTFQTYFGTGYNTLRIGERIFLTLRAGLWYIPSITLNRFPEAINGANLYGLKDQASNLFLPEAGLSFTWERRKHL